MKRTLEEEAAAHQDALFQLSAELESLRSEHAAAVGHVEAMTGERNLLAAAQEQSSTEQQRAEQARQAERAEFTQQLEALHQQLEAEKSRSDELTQQHRSLQTELEHLRQERETDRQTHEQALEAFRTERDAVRHDAEAVRQFSESARIGSGLAPAATATAPATDQYLADLQSQLANAERSRNVLVDALKVAQQQIETLSADLEETRQEQYRVRAILDGMGIHLL
jgi:chromosome segregation ATPase